MKKIISLILATVMLAVAVSLVSCGGNNSSVTTTEPGSTTTNANTTTTNANVTTTAATTTAATTTEAATTTKAPDTPVAPAYASAIELYNKIWASYADDEKFPSAGGDADHSSSDPGVVDIEKYKDTIMWWTHVTEELLGTVTNDAANLMHMMNTNTFSSAIFHLKDASTAEAFASDYNKAIQGTRWMCGFPDNVVVISVGEYIIVAFGNNELINTFKTKCLAADSAAKVLVDAPIEA